MNPQKNAVQSAYDKIAEKYAKEVTSSPYNAGIDRPRTTALIPSVSDKRILDAGCGTGHYTEWLVENGADVVGIDLSSEMLSQARERFDDNVEFHQNDLETPIDFADSGSFDGVVSGLALGHDKDLETTFSEFARLLAPGGFLVFSIGHPFNEFPLEADQGYFDVEQRTEAWSVEMPYYSRPLQEIINPLIDSGFILDHLSEHQPPKHLAEDHPEVYEKTKREPVFLAVRAYNSLTPEELSTLQ